MANQAALLHLSGKHWLEFNQLAYVKRGGEKTGGQEGAHLLFIVGGFGRQRDSGPAGPESRKWPEELSRRLDCKTKAIYIYFSSFAVPRPTFVSQTLISLSST